MYSLDLVLIFLDSKRRGSHLARNSVVVGSIPVRGQNGLNDMYKIMVLCHLWVSNCAL